MGEGVLGNKVTQLRRGKGEKEQDRLWSFRAGGSIVIVVCLIVIVVCLIVIVVCLIVVSLPPRHPKHMTGRPILAGKQVDGLPRENTTLLYSQSNHRRESGEGLTWNLVGIEPSARLWMGNSLWNLFVIPPVTLLVLPILASLVFCSDVYFFCRHF